jgi:hypothetical protein
MSFFCQLVQLHRRTVFELQLEHRLWAAGNHKLDSRKSCKSEDVLRKLSPQPNVGFLVFVETIDEKAVLAGDIRFCENSLQSVS